MRPGTLPEIRTSSTSACPVMMSSPLPKKMKPDAANSTIARTTSPTPRIMLFLAPVSFVSLFCLLSILTYWFIVQVSS